MAVLSVRIDPELEKKLEFLMRAQQIVDKSAYVRQLLARSIAEDVIEYLCSQVKAKQLSAWKAAELAQVSLQRMLAELAKRQVSLYDDQSLAEDLAFALRD